MLPHVGMIPYAMVEHQSDEHEEVEPYEQPAEDLFVFRINIANQHASWPASKWSAFAAILAVCLAAVTIAGLWAWAPAANVEAMMGTMFSDKPAAAQAAVQDLKNRPLGGD
jgi:hypothetical protein